MGLIMAGLGLPLPGYPVQVYMLEVMIDIDGELFHKAFLVVTCMSFKIPTA